MGFDHLVRDIRHIRPVPARCLVLVDQAGAHAFGEFRVAAAVQAQGIFHAKHLGQGQLPGAADLLPDQVPGQRAAAGQGLGRAGQQQVAVAMQSGDGLPGLGQVGHIQQRVDLCAAWQPLGLGQLAACFGFQGLEQAMQLQLGLRLPVELSQAVDQGVLLVVAQKTVGQVQVQGIRGVDAAGSQTEEQTELARQAGEEPAAAHIRVQADIHLRHAQTAAGGDDTDGRTLHQAHAAAQHMAMGPADKGLGIGVDQVVQAVFVGKETPRQGRNLPRVLAALLHQLHHIAAGAEGLGPVAAQQYAGDARIIRPGLEAVGQGFDHRQGQGIEALLGIQAGDADTHTLLGGAFFELHVHGRFHRRVDGVLTIHRMRFWWM